MPLIDISDTYQMTNVGAHIDATEVSATHPNLLDNWWFGTGVINQRGATSGSAQPSRYNIFDRWLTSYGSAAGTFSIASDGITLTAASGTHINIQQRIANYSPLVGKTLTASVLLSDGTILNGTKAFTGSGTVSFYSANNIQITLSASGYFTIYVTSGQTKTLKAAKLEVGSVSTLANDAPPNPAEELAKCQRYFQRIKIIGSSVTSPFAFGWSQSATSLRAFLPVPVTMRSTPSISVNLGDATVTIAGNGTTHTISAWDIQNIYTHGVILMLTTSGLTANNIYCVYQNSTAFYIDLSADL